MRLMRRVNLNGDQLDQVDDRIIITAIEESAAKLTVGSATRYGMPGQRLTSKHRDTLDVVVKFTLAIKKNDLRARSELFEAVAAWAMKGGWLSTNYKRNRRLRVECVGLPSAGDLATWETEYEITFRAFGVPYWQEESPTTLTVASTKSAIRNMSINGTADSVLDVTFTNISGMTINTFSIKTSNSTFSFTSLALGANESLVIDHTALGILRIRIKSSSGTYRSAMAMRAESSSDDLVMSPGTETITVTAQRAGKLDLTCYGRYV